MVEYETTHLCEPMSLVVVMVKKANGSADVGSFQLGELLRGSQ